MPYVRYLASVAATFLIHLTLASEAKADALPPPLPLTCAKGTTLVHNHGGTHCVPNAPSDCPAGWLGVMGGNCTPNLCGPNDTCGAGLQCKPADLCATEAMGYRYGAIESSRGPLLGAPPAPQWIVSYSEACSEAKTCEGKAQCVASKVCLPPDVSRLAPRPANARNAERAGVQSAPLPLATGASKDTRTATSATQTSAKEPAASATPSTQANTPPAALPSVQPPGRGGAGCSTLAEPNAVERHRVGPYALGFGLAVLTLVRRRKR
jgi:hypothetical protein